MEKNIHLDLSARIIIEAGLDDGRSFKAIAADLGKDPGTISKEIRGHILFEKKGAAYYSFNDCVHRQTCEKENVCPTCTNSRKHATCRNCGKCIGKCPDYQREICVLLAKPPYVCNGCKQATRCRLEKRTYHARAAQTEYEETRTESRSGFSLTEEERKSLDGVISPLLKKGQSIHHICIHNADEIMYSEKTLYAYADAGLFEARNLDMPRKVRLRPRNKKSTEMKVDKKCRENRTYKDFLAYMEQNPELPVVELDSVEGIKGGAVLLTIYFRGPKLQLAFRRDRNDSASVTAFFRFLYEELGEEEYRKLFPVVLADNGSEFSNPCGVEMSPNEEKICSMFYCNPGNPGQKGGCEFNHEFIRRVIPKGKDLTPFSQQDITLLMSHINSYSRPDLGDRSPLEMFRFMYPESKLLSMMGLVDVPANDINLTPSLLQKADENTEK